MVQLAEVSVLKLSSNRTWANPFNENVKKAVTRSRAHWDTEEDFMMLLIC
jgi:hypothetical protein